MCAHILYTPEPDIDPSGGARDGKNTQIYNSGTHRHTHTHTTPSAERFFFSSMLFGCVVVCVTRRRCFVFGVGYVPAQSLVGGLEWVVEQ